MKSTSKQSLIWLPLAIAISVIVGIVVGNRFTNQKYSSDYDRKLNTILNLIADDYVDTVNIHDLIEMSIPQILSNLDPHTTYFSAKDLKAANEELDGSFSGIGISFMMINDTVGNRSHPWRTGRESRHPSRRPHIVDKRLGICRSKGK